MTLHELNEHYRLRRDLARAMQLRDSLREAVVPGAQALTGMPRAPGYRDKLGDLTAEIVDVSRDIDRLKMQISAQEKAISAFVQGIDDPFVRTVFTLRFLRMMTWDDVADTVGGGNTRASVSSICYRYLKTCRTTIHMLNDNTQKV